MNVLAKRTIRNHSGFALIAFLLVLVTGASLVLLRGLNAAATQSYRDAQTASALAEAKAALIGYAASRGLSPVSGARPGDLPCPDWDNDGTSGVPGSVDASCGDSTGSTGQSKRLGRLPWKLLRLPDLRDGDGERLWYAVSTNFKNNTKSICNDGGDPGCLNSDARGTITVRAPNDIVVHDGRNLDPLTPSGVVAVVFSPGKILRRQGDSRDQDRSCFGGSCNANDVCTSSPPTDTRKCDPIEYLDKVDLGEDNAIFVEEPVANRTDGFIQGEVFASGNVIVNDRLLTITYQDLMPLLEKRVVGEILACLKKYAARPLNSGRYPWAAPLGGGAAPSYVGVTDTRFGRLPDDSPSLTVAPAGMETNWPNECNISAGTNWWLNWKELIFYSVADAYKPTTSPTPPGCASSTCLTVNRPPPFASLANRQTVVIAAGKRLAGVAGDQPRTGPADKGNVSNYLENDNATPLPPTMDESFIAGNATATFNDVVCNNGSCL